jgi:SAM-dependent methyltransferase
MKRTLLKHICCPECNSQFKLITEEISHDEIKKGRLECKKCGRMYPIIRYIPRFVKTDTNMESFSFEWEKHARTQVDSSKDRRSEKSFFNKTNFNRSKLKGKLVLDAGCGTGRYTDIASRSGGEVIGFDLSFAVDYAYKNLGMRKNVHIIQADMFNLPFKKETFDYVFSIGVLHHTGNAKKAFKSILKLLKRGGEIGIWVYSNQNPVTVRATKFWRIFTTRIPKRLFYYMCYLAIPLYYIKKIPLFYPLLLLMPSSMDKGWDWIVLVTFDWYSPTFMTFHSYPEVFGWFKDNNVSITHLGEPTAVAGTKK